MPPARGHRPDCQCYRCVITLPPPSFTPDVLSADEVHGVRHLLRMVEYPPPVEPTEDWERRRCGSREERKLARQAHALEELHRAHRLLKKAAKSLQRTITRQHREIEELVKERDRTSLRVRDILSVEFAPTGGSRRVHLDRIEWDVAEDRWTLTGHTVRP